MQKVQEQGRSTNKCYTLLNIIWEFLITHSYGHHRIISNTTDKEIVLPVALQVMRQERAREGYYGCALAWTSQASCYAHPKGQIRVRAHNALNEKSIHSTLYIT